jgi:hypothetical protein
MPTAAGGVLLAAALAAGCSSAHPQPAAQPASQAAAQAALTPAQRCAVTVEVLLSKTVSAMEDGYQGGIDVNQIMDEYGAQSAVFQAFAQLDGQVMGYVVQHGPGGSVASVGSQPQQLCQEYGT